MLYVSDGTSATEGTSEDSTAIDRLVGETLGSYRLLARLASGGMGVVYRGEHKRLRRSVAIKVLRPDRVHSRDAARRFLDEARIVNEIRHPNIVDIVDFVEDYDADPPRVYAVMELLKGQDLADCLLEKLFFSAKETVDIAMQVADALTATHEIQILHRDLKPANIFLCRGDGAAPRVKLLDFGVSKTLGDRPSASITDPGTSVGTPIYMAPEQVLGKRLDARTDIYALGIVLYQMLVGRVPFEGETAGEILVDQVKKNPTSLSQREPVGQYIPRRLESIVMRCLEKDRDKRFESAAALRQALADVDTTLAHDTLDDEYDEITFASPGRRRWRWGVYSSMALLLGLLGVALTRSTADTEPTANTSEGQLQALNVPTLASPEHARPVAKPIAQPPQTTDKAASAPEVAAAAAKLGAGAGTTAAGATRPDGAPAADQIGTHQVLAKRGTAQRKKPRTARKDTAAAKEVQQTPSEAPGERAGAQSGQDSLEGTVDPFSQL